MTNVNKKITLLICLVLSLLMIFVLSSCDNGETPADSSTNTDTSTDSSTDTSTDTGTDDNTPDVPTGCIIEEAEGFDFDTTGTTPKIYKNVSNSTEIIDLSGSITVTEGCTWRMYKDFLGENEYKLKSMSLSIGENKAYIVVYHPDGETFTRYELVLYRLDMKDYSFISDNAPYENGTIEELSSVEAPTANPQKIGYDFMGWTVDGEIVSFPYQVSEDTIFEAKFAPIEYEIEYNLNGGVNNAENSLKYTIEQSVALLEPTRDFYTFAGWYESDDFEGNAITEIAEGSYGNKTFYAKWAPITYDINYVLNGGTNNAENPSTYNTEIRVVLKAPTKAGYTFAGWFADKDFSIETTGISLGEGNAKTFYAKWNANENTIVFNANSGSGSMINMTVATDSTVKLTTNAFTKDGYTFKGWATSKDGNVVYTDGASYKMGTNSSYTLYAVWEANRNTLVFDANDGSGSMSNMTIATDSTVKLTNNAFTKAGYTFKGWATSKDGSVKYSNGASYTMGTESTYTLYAVWEKNINGLVFNGNGATSGSMSSIEIATGDTASIPNNSFIRNGYTFIGWSTSANGSVVYTNGASYTMGTSSTYVLYAVWQANENTIVFNGNGATSGSMSSMTVKTDETVTLSSNKFAKTGYTFKGWATSSSGNVVYADEASYTMGTNSSYTLYAVWEANQNTIVFDANGGSGSMPNMTVATDSTVKLTTNTFVKAGYSFIGWATTADGNVEYADGASYTMGTDSSYTLYAVWRANENILVFNGNGATSGSTPSMRIATDDTAELTANGFVRDGYTFVGWSTSASGSVKYTDGANYAMGTNSTYTLYAVWEANKNTLVFDANGGSGSMSNMTIATDSQSKLTSNAFTKAGYTFKGWATTKGGSVVYADAASYTMGTNSSYTLYAVWEANQNTLVFNANGGSGSMPNMTIATDSTAKLTSNTFTKAGYTFKGWATSKGGSVVYADGATYTMGTDSTYTLYAVWQANENTIVFDGNGATSGVMSNMTLSTDSTANLTINTYTKNGCYFIGWATIPNGSVVYANGASYTMGTNSMYTLYAVWESYLVTVEFDSNGGTEVEPQKVELNKKAKEPATPIREGYTLDGWYLGNDKWSFIGYVVSEDMTLVAKWIPNNNTIVFDANGGSGTMSNMTIATDSTAKLTSNAFTKAGYTFKGWSTTASGSVEYTNGASYTMGTESTYTLYAIWEANENTLVFNANGGSGSMPNMTIATDASKKLSINAFTRNGYTFKGWSTSRNGSVNYVDGASYTMGANSSYTLYAVWEANQNTLVFNANGGVGTMENMTIATDSTVWLNTNTFTKEYYTFKGWATNVNGNVVYSNGARYTMGANSTYTLYAVWELTEYDITYVLNDGTNNSQNPSTYNVEETITLASPTRKGYFFKGWFTESTFENEITSISLGSSGKKTLYAKWEIIEYTITYNKNGGTEGTANPTTFTIEDLPIALNDLNNKTDYLFNYWYKESDFSGAPVTKITDIGNIELFASYINSTEGLVFTNFHNIWGITDYTGNSTNVVIPDNYKGNSVTSIEMEAFSGCTSLTSITIPDSVERIVGSAFYNCTSLDMVTIPNSVTSIGGFAFSGCTSLTSITIPDSVTSIGYATFYNCTSLDMVTIPNSVTSIGSRAFENCTLLDMVTIPNSVTSIGDMAFYGCKSLTSVTIPNSVTSIGDSAFKYCTSLTSITIPNSVTSIGTDAFYNCTALTSITIPSSVTSIGNNAFFGCPIENATIPTNLILHISKTNLKTLVINGGTSIGDRAFYNCTSLESITIGNSVTSIGEFAFYGCTSLTSVTIPDSVTSIGDYAFQNCTSLTIYCEATSKSSGWNSNWNYSIRPVVWGHMHSYTDGECICGTKEN